MRELGKFFKTERRRGKGNGEEGELFTSLADGAPEWLREAVYEAHHGMLPNDWVFEECRAACDAIDEGSIEPDSDGDDLHQHVEGRVDPYTKDVFQWAADMCLTMLFSLAEERASELGHDGDDTDTSKRLNLIQYCAIEIVAQAMLDAAREHRGNDGGDDIAEKVEAS